MAEYFSPQRAFNMFGRRVSATNYFSIEIKQPISLQVENRFRIIRIIFEFNKTRHRCDYVTYKTCRRNKTKTGIQGFSSCSGSINLFVIVGIRRYRFLLPIDSSMLKKLKLDLERKSSSKIPISYNLACAKT